MRRLLSILITLLWGLWFGGLVTLFIAVTSIFAALPGHRDLAGQAAAHVFRVFNIFQLSLAAAALLATFAWRLKTGPAAPVTAVFSLFAAATVGACVITLYIAPEIGRLQHMGLAATPRFAQMHGASMIVYLAETLALLIAGIFLPWRRVTDSGWRRPD